MRKKEFAQKVQDAVKKKLGEGYQVSLQEVTKNNCVTMQGLMISEEGKNVFPMIYLDSFRKAYEAGMPISAIVKRIMDIYGKDGLKEDIDMDFFKNFDEVKDRICYRLINREKNQELLSKIPHMEFLDLAICFYYAYQGKELGDGSILIYNTHMELWGTSPSQLFLLAKENSPRLFPWECKTMEEALREMTGVVQGEEPEEWQGAVPMRILGNSSHAFGASCILYPGLLEELAAGKGSGFYILPSSIHEVILLDAENGDDARADAKILRQMIADVNDTQVEPEDILSYHLYYYDSLNQNLSICSLEIS